MRRTASTVSVIGIRPAKFAVFFAALLASCNATRDRSQLREAMPLSAETAVPIDCGSGEAMYLGLEALSEKPDVSTLNLPVSIADPTLPYSWEDPESGRNIRIAACLRTSPDGVDRLDVKQVAYRQVEGSSRVMTVPASAQIVDVESALFGTPSETLKFEVPEEFFRHGSDSSPILSPLVFNMRSLPGGNGVYVFVGEKIDGVMKPFSFRLLVGKLVVKDLLATTVCSSDVLQREFRFSVEAFNLSGVVCNKDISTGTTSFEIQTLKVTGRDGQTLLDATTNDDVNEHVKTKINHHNGCDSVVVTLDALTIGMTTSAVFGGGCGEVLPSAPIRAPGMIGNVFYRIAESETVIAEGKKVAVYCSHPFVGVCVE